MLYGPTCMLFESIMNPNILLWKYILEPNIIFPIHYDPFFSVFYNLYSLSKLNLIHMLLPQNQHGSNFEV
jgi:hypothetical protein